MSSHYVYTVHMSEQRERILSEACDLFLAGGLEGVSMRRLAAAVGVTAPALYRYYESKEHVLHDVLGEAYRRLAAYMFKALEGRTPAERLVLATEGYAAFALDNGRLYDILFASPEHLGLAALPDDLAAQGLAIGQFWDDRIRECIDAGILAENDAGEVSTLMWAQAHGLISLFTRRMLDDDGISDRATFLALYRRALVRLLEGMGRPGAVEQLASVGGVR